MKKQYERRSFKADSLKLINRANKIIDEYEADGYTLTLRQLYYQFVARGLIENTQRSYKRLGNTISNARLAGLISWEAIVDRTRNVRANQQFKGVGDILEAAAGSHRLDLWRGQTCVVEVWIEKEALIGVMQPVCVELDLPYFSCRGYVSQSEQWRAGQRAMTRWSHEGQKTVILHLGDHDPSGVDMTRDNQDRLALFTEWSQIVDARRIALNQDQIEEFNPPPNPAKTTDSRSGEYFALYGKSSWELDALEPRVIGGLIRDTASEYLDFDRFNTMKARQEADRKELYDLVESHAL